MKIYKYLDKAEKHIKVKMFMLNMYRIKQISAQMFLHFHKWGQLWQCVFKKAAYHLKSPPYASSCWLSTTEWSSKPTKKATDAAKDNYSQAPPPPNSHPKIGNGNALQVLRPHSGTESRIILFLHTHTLNMQPAFLPQVLPDLFAFQVWF